ncbi:MAG: hypothetical protein SVU32_06030 [Candidatus Nanohaloarchaea archaeon]|nr:hypothetical protein [Candidatus Nanohaloarchaea archaeon]
MTFTEVLPDIETDDAGNRELKIRHQSTELTEEEADQLRVGASGYTVQVIPPGDGPATLDRFVKNIYEPQTKWLGLQNTSPVTCLEIRRTTPDAVRFQFTVPTKRMERKIRTQLTAEVPDVEFTEGSTGLPVSEGATLGGGLVTTGRLDRYPLATDFDAPPMNSVAAALHRHAMQDSSFVIQILFQPFVGQPVRSWWWKKRAYMRRNSLRKEKEKLWGTRQPTPRERQQADAIEDKAGSPRFTVSIRFAIIGAGEYTKSRVKELAGAFNVYENPETGQYLDAVTVTPFRESQLLDFGQAVAQQRFGGWSHRFQASTQELAGLLALPTINQENIATGGAHA